MSITVTGYQRHINGKLVTVSGYASDRNQLYPNPHPAHTPVHKENIARGQLEATQGTYVQGSVTRGLGGLTAYLYKPGGPTNRDVPEYRWRRTHLPIRGAYNIPKKESGNIE